MALTPGKPAGSYFEWDQAANENAVVVFKIREIMEPRPIPPNDNIVHPVLVDAVILTGSQAKTVVRGEETIGAGFKSLRNYATGADVVAIMSFKPNKHGGKPFIAADPQPVDTDAFKMAAEVFEKTNGDPYSHAERAANPTATLATAPAAPAPTPPAAGAPAPWGNNTGGNGGNQPAPVGGPQGASWDQSAPAAQPQPVSAGSAW